MNSLAKRKKTALTLLTIITAVCLAAAIALSLSRQNAFAQENGDETDSSAKTPIFTYLIGDETVTDENGFIYDETANTYTYADHTKGWSAAILKSNTIGGANGFNLVKVVLVSDWSLNDRILFKDSKSNILLDLNDCKIDRQLTEAKENGYLFSVSQGSLEITDSGENGRGCLTGGNNKFSGGAIYQSGGKLTLSGGNITGNTAQEGGAVFMQSGTMIINGGSISRNEAKNGGAIIIKSESCVIMNGGTISGNYAQFAGGIYGYGGTLDISGGAIKGNSSSGSGSGIHIKVNMNIKFSGTAYLNENFSNGKFNESTGVYEQGTGTLSNFYATASLTNKIATGKLENGANIGIGLVSNAAAFTSGYGENNKDDNGIIVNPCKYFDNSTMSFVLNEEGEVQFSNKGALFWTVNGEKTENYGKAIVYSEGNVNAIGLKQGTTDVTDIIVKKDGSDEPINLSANPLTQAGTYYATATVSGIDNKTIQVKFAVVILPYELTADNTTAALMVSGWTENENGYSSPYSGTEQSVPTATVSLGATDLSADDYEMYYLINEQRTDTLVNVGEYTVVIAGKGNYTGTVFLTKNFYITPNTENEYTVTWQYYDGTKWNAISSNYDSVFTFTNEDYSKYVRIVLSTENETRYVYASGVTEYNLDKNEQQADVTPGLTVWIASEKNADIAGGEPETILNAGNYNLTLHGEPNYTVAEENKNSSICVAKYDLSNITEESTDTAEITATLDNETYNAKEKTLTLTASAVLNGNVIELGNGGVEFERIIKYVNAGGTETEVNSIVIGGAYKIYLVATGNNITGTLGVIAQVAVNKATNHVTLSGTGNWIYGTYDIQVNGISGSAAVLYDGNIAGTEQAYVYYSVNNSAGKPVNATLTRFTSLTDEVVAAMNALGAGNYTLVAEADETESYDGATNSATFNVVKATNSWLKEPSVISWEWNNYDNGFDHLIAAAKYGNADIVKTVKDANGVAIEGLTNITAVTDKVVEKLRGMSAGNYTLSVAVVETADYGGLDASVEFTVEKAENAWTTAPHLTRWVAGYYDSSETYITGAAKYGETTYTVTDAEGNEITDLAALEAGEYIITMCVAGTDNYEGITYTEKFLVFESTDLTGGEIAGVVVGGAVVFGLAVTVAVLFIKRRKL